MHIICFFHTATIIFYLPILGNPNLQPALFYLPVGAFLPVFTLLLQPARFSMSSAWCIPPHFYSFAPICFLLYVFRLVLSFPFLLFCSNTFASLCLPVGAFFPVAPLLLQSASFSMSSGWSNPSRFYSFAPTRLLLYVLRLVFSFPFLLFCSNTLPSLCLPLGAFLPVAPLLLQSASFSMSSGWSFLSRCATFTPNRFLLYVLRLVHSFPLRHFYSKPLATECMCLGDYHAKIAPRYVE